MAFQPGTRIMRITRVQAQRPFYFSFNVLISGSVSRRVNPKQCNAEIDRQARLRITMRLPAPAICNKLGIHRGQVGGFFFVELVHTVGGHKIVFRGGMLLREVVVHIYVVGVRRHLINR